MSNTIHSIEIKQAVTRIHDALSRRFERDLNLYVSKEQLEDIKIHLSKGELQAIKGLFSTNRLSADALTLTTLSNAWLLPSKIKPYDLQQYLSPIFASCQPKILKQLSEKIINDQISVPANLKLFMIQQHNQKNLSLDECYRLLSSADKNTTLDELEIWLKRISEQPKDIQSFYKIIDDLVRKIPSLANNQNFFVKTISTEKFSEQDKSWLAQKIYQIHLNRTELPMIWFDFFAKKLGSKTPIECFENTLLQTSDKESLKALTTNLIKVIQANRNSSLEPWILQRLQHLYQNNQEVQYGLLLRADRLPKTLQHQFIQWIGLNIPANNRGFIEKYNEVKSKIESGEGRDNESFDSLSDIQAKLNHITEANLNRTSGYIIRHLIKKDVNSSKILMQNMLDQCIRLSNSIECGFLATWINFRPNDPEQFKKHNQIQEFALKYILQQNIASYHILIKKLLTEFENLKVVNLQDSNSKKFAQSHTHLKEFLRKYDFNGLYQKLSLI